MRVRPTGSRVHRIWRCPPSLILPQIESDDPSPARDFGTAIHAFLERAALVGAEHALGELRDARLRLLAQCLDLADLPTHLATEVAFAYDWRQRTARELGRNIGRPYATPGMLTALGLPELGPTELGLTIDLVGVQVVHETRLGYVSDYKSGHSKYPTPDRFGQTMTAACAARAVYSLDESIVELIFVHDDGTHGRSRARVDAWDLDEFADELEAAFDAAGEADEAYRAGRGVDVREGPQCNNCGAFAQCPAKISLVRQIPRVLGELGVEPEFLRGDPGTTLELRPGSITKENVAAAFMLAERIEEITARLKLEAQMIAAREGDVDLPDGRVLGRYVHEWETLDGTIAGDVVAGFYDADARRQVVKESASKDAIRELVVARKQPGDVITSKKGTGVLDRVLAEIRARGGMKQHRSDTVKPHQPRRVKRLR
jgi:hypothetical protein